MLICPICGKRFTGHPYRINETCSRACGRARSGLRRRGLRLIAPVPDPADPLWGDRRLRAHFWSTISRSENGCWVWLGAPASTGYGKFSFRGRQMGAHQAAYLALVGEVGPGLHLDHLCRNRLCVNPDHLEAVPPGVNAKRGMAPMILLHHANKCIRGHDFTPENTYIHSVSGRRQCRACIGIRRRARSAEENHDA